MRDASKTFPASRFPKLKKMQRVAALNRRLVMIGGASILLVGVSLFPVSGVHANSHNANVGDCTKQSSFLTLPTWYSELQCEDGGSGAPVFSDLNDIWIVTSNIFNIAIQTAGLVAVVFIIYGGIQYTMSQGDPEKLKTAKGTLTNAIIGLVLAILASTIVGFIAGSFA